MCGFGAYDFDQDRFTKTEPKPQKMVGDYLPTKGTMTFIRETGRYDVQDISISLFSDGTFKMQNMPDWWMTTGPQFGKSNGGADSGNGTWSIAKTGNWWWQINFKFEPGNFKAREDLSDGFLTTKDISGEKPPYSLWFYVGDPDTGNVMIFEQVLGKIP